MEVALDYSGKKFQFATEYTSPRFVTRLTKNTYAMVLAGGHDCRLHQLTSNCAKAAVHFGGKYRIIDFVLSNCMNSGIRHIGIATQYQSNDLIQHIKRGWSFLNGNFSEFVDVLPSQQRVNNQCGYQGTADAAFQNIDILRAHTPDYVLILPGDHVYKMDYGKLLAFHVEKQADITIACLEVSNAEKMTHGVVKLDKNLHVTDFSQHPACPASFATHQGNFLANMGIYVFNSQFLFNQLILDSEDPHSGHDFGRDIIPRMIVNNKVFSQNFSDSCVGTSDIPYWRDSGSIDSYWEANIGLTNVTPDLNIYDRNWPIWTRHEQSAPAKFVFDEIDKCGMAVDSLVSGGCIIKGSNVRRSLLFYDVHVDCFSTIEDSILLPNVKIGRSVTLKKVIVDKHCLIPDGFTAGVCAEADCKYFDVSPNGVTLITSEALKNKYRHAPEVKTRDTEKILR